MSGEVKLLHLSDLHFGPGTAIDVDIKDEIGETADFPTFRDRLIVFLKQAGLRFDYVLVTGDLTIAGRVQGLREFLEFVDDLQDTGIFPQDANIVVVPGNHDVTRPEDPFADASISKRYRNFARLVGSRFPHPFIAGLYEPTHRARGAKRLRDHPNSCYVFDAVNRLFVFALDTTRFCGVRQKLEPQIERRLRRSPTAKLSKEIDRLTLWDAGYAGPQQLLELSSTCDRLRSMHGHQFEESVKICLCHHPLLPLVGEQTEIKKGHILLDSGQVQRYLIDYGFDVVLHGHKHYPRGAIIEAPELIGGRVLRTDSCGTIGSGGERSFSVLTLKPGRLERQRFRLEDLPAPAQSVLGAQEPAVLWPTGVDVDDGGRLTWKAVEYGITRLVDYLESVNFRPDIVVSIGRGGAVFAGLLASRLDAPRVVSLERSVQKKGPVSEIRLGQLPAKEVIEDQKVLLADALVRSAESLARGWEAINSLGPAEIKTVALSVVKGVGKVELDASVWEFDQVVLLPWHSPGFKHPEERES